MSYMISSQNYYIDDCTSTTTAPCQDTFTQYIDEQKQLKRSINVKYSLIEPKDNFNVKEVKEAVKFLKRWLERE
jgi:hypothetical protein